MTEKNSRRILWLIIILALLVRILPALFTENLNHPDENFQILEQAHRVVFGYGLIPWEFRHDARSWIVPGLTAILLYPFKLLRLDRPDIYIPGLRIIFSIISLSVIFSAWFIARHRASLRAGLLAAFFCAVWYEIVYFSMRPFSEVWAAVFFMAALALATGPSGNRRLVLAGFLMALTAAVRIHYAVVIPVALVMICREHDRSGLYRAVAGAAAALVLVGLFEKLTVGGFFASYINYFRLGRTFSLAGAETSSSLFHYVLQLGYNSLFLFWLLAVAAAVFWKKTGYLLLSAALVIAVHSVIPMKAHLAADRFVYLTIPLLLTAAAIAINELIARIRAPFRTRLLGLLIPVIFVLFSVAGAVGLGPRHDTPYGCRLFARDSGLIAYKYLHDNEHLQALYDDGFWFHSGGCYYLHRDIPLYFANTPPPSLDHISHILTGQEISLTMIFEPFRIDSVLVYSRRNTDFECAVDSTYTRHMLQPGIDRTARPH